MPEGIYAEIRDLNNLRIQATQQLTRVKNRLARWFSIYFPEFPSLYSDINAVSAKLVLERAPLPEDIIALDVDGVNQLWREAKIRAVGMKKASQIVEAAKRSIGRKESLRAARIEIKENRQFKESIRSTNQRYPTGKHTDNRAVHIIYKDCSN